MMAQVALNELGKIESLAYIARELSHAKTFDDVTGAIRRSLRGLVGADGVTFVLKSGLNCCYVEEDAMAPLWKGRKFPQGHCISGWVMSHRKSVAIEDVYTDTRIRPDYYRSTFVKSLAMAPIRESDPLGAIGMYWASTHTASPGEMAVLQAVADMAAVSIENIRAYAELETRVQERTAELEERNRDLEAFAYSISHDLRAPLRGISSYMGMFLEDHGTALSPDGLKLCGRVQHNAATMVTMVEGMLELFKLGKKDLRRTMIQMQPMVATLCLDLMEQQAQVKYRLDLKALPDCMGDAMLIRQVWSNLISNALKYSRKNPEPVIEIGSADTRRGVAFYVRDNGVGFDMNTAQKLFGVFQRLHGQREFEGSGIGLAIVKKIVEKHGGEVWATAEKGKGATFYFTLK